MPGTFKFSWDTGEFVRNADELSKQLHRDLVPVLKEMVGSFANVAAQWTPYAGLSQKEVMQRHNTMKRRDLFNEIVDMNNPGAYELDRTDYIWRAKGYRYKVLFDRIGRMKNPKPYYYKTRTEADQARRMKTAGLARAMWRKECREHRSSCWKDYQRCTEQITLAQLA